MAARAAAWDALGLSIPAAIRSDYTTILPVQQAFAVLTPDSPFLQHKIMIAEVALQVLYEFAGRLLADMGIEKSESKEARGRAREEMERLFERMVGVEMVGVVDEELAGVMMGLGIGREEEDDENEEDEGVMMH